MKANRIWILFMAWSMQLSFIVADSKETNQSLQKLLSSKEATMCKKHSMKTSKVCESFFRRLEEVTVSTSTSGFHASMEVPASKSNVIARILNGRRLQQEGCVLLLKQIIYEDHEEEQVECFDQTTGQIVSLAAFESHILQMVKSGAIESGAATLIQEGAYFDDENRRLILDEGAQLDSLTIAAKSKDNRRKLFTGTKSFLALRVEALDNSTTSSESEISDSWFGTIDDLMNFKSQMEACSYGKFKVSPVSNNIISNGVYTVNISNNVTGVDDEIIANAAVAAGNSALGNMESQYDHVMVCVPPGANGDWIAYAYVNHYLSVYNDQWCNYPSGQMHEIGHNLGLAHSGEGFSEYGDQSGMMGFSYSSDDTPNMCFNAPKNAQLGWYDDKLLTVSGTGWSGSLYGISDYESSDASTVIAKIPGSTYGSTDDWYVSFNRNTGVNSGTVEGANRVLVHKRESGNDYEVSTLMAKLTAGQSYNVDGIPFSVIVNTISTFAEVTIGRVTSEPSSIPSDQPSSHPSLQQSDPPSNQPSLQPSSIPSLFPSDTPSLIHSSKPSDTPSLQPSSSPSLFPSDIPSSLPSSNQSESSKPSEVPSSTTDAPLCKKFKYDPSSGKQFGVATGPLNYFAEDGQSLREWCDSLDNPCCTGNNNLALAAKDYECGYWSDKAGTTYEVCENSCVNDRACTHVARNCADGSYIKLSKGSCSDEASCYNMAESTTKKLNIEIGEGSCFNPYSCSSMAREATNLRSIVVGTNSCTKNGACHYAASKATSLTQLIVNDNQCTSDDIVCYKCGQDSSFNDALKLTQQCCAENEQYFDEACNYVVPSIEPSNQPSISSIPSSSSLQPSSISSLLPSDTPSLIHSSEPSDTPSLQPSSSPSLLPSDTPSLQPSSSPSLLTLDTPSLQPSLLSKPSNIPSLLPSDIPSGVPSSIPSSTPSVVPSNVPSLLEPSSSPSNLPSIQPSKNNNPSFSPLAQPSAKPSANPAPTNTNVCIDSGVKFKKNTDVDGKYKKRSCAWLLRKPSRTQSRCGFGKKQRLKSHCPNACGVCEEYKCADSEKKWFLWGNNRVRDCKWVASSENSDILSKRCNKDGVAATCRATCKYTNSTLGLVC